MKTPPPRKTSDLRLRHNTRPIRTRQLPALLGEKVFTRLVKTSDDRPGEHTSTYVTTPPSTTSLEAITILTESHQIVVVDLTSPLTPPLCHSTINKLMKRGTESLDKTKHALELSFILSPKKVEFKSEVRISEFDPSDLPSEPADVIDTPIVNNPDLLNTPSIIAERALLGHPMILDERKWTETRASNRDAA